LLNYNYFLFEKNIFWLGIGRNNTQKLNDNSFQLGADIPIGSCTYDGSMILQLANLCPEHCPEGQVSDLPLNPGTYGGNKKLKLLNASFI
jgi:hypothetical protein